MSEPRFGWAAAAFAATFFLVAAISVSFISRERETYLALKAQERKTIVADAPSQPQAGQTGEATKTQTKTVDSEYLRNLVARILTRKFTPAGASTGQVTVGLSFDRFGDLIGEKVLRSSGSNVLDQAALRIVKMAAPYPLPSGTDQDHFSFKIPIDFGAEHGMTPVAARTVAKRADADEPKTGTFERRQSLKCDATDVELVTFCVHPREEGECPEQRATFKNGSREWIVDYFHYQTNKSDQSFVTSMSCVELKKTPYIMFSSTNFGNCADCEWVELFYLDGSYFGGTNGMSNDDNIPFKPLPAELVDSIFGTDKSREFRELSTVEISR